MYNHMPTTWYISHIFIFWGNGGCTCRPRDIFLIFPYVTGNGWCTRRPRDIFLIFPYVQAMADTCADHVKYFQYFHIYYRQWLMHAQTTWSTSKCLTYRSGMGSMVLSDWKAREGKVSKLPTQNQQSAVNTGAQHNRTPRFKSGSDFFGLSDSLKVQCVSIIKPVLGQSLTHQKTHPGPLLSNHVKK